MESLDQWIEQQYRRATVAMLRSLSPVAIIKQRPGFGQTVVPKKGSIVASPVLAAYDPDPDYFFHWFRDSAVVIDAVRLLRADGSLSGTAALEYFRDFVHFSLSLLELDGRALVASPGWRTAVAADFVKFVRSEAELASVRGELVAAEARVNPDGTLDISRWGRPQHDGPPLRLLTTLRWLRDVGSEGELATGAAALVRADIAFTRGCWQTPSVDIWEEEKGHHYYTLRVAAAALLESAAWLEAQQGARNIADAQCCRAESQAILRMLDGYWLPDAGYYRSRVLEGGMQSTKELDIAVIFAAIHGVGSTEAAGAHTVHDPRMQATLARLEELFGAEYPINSSRPRWRGAAMGRYKGDVYYSGGAYYFSTLAAAEFCFRAAVGRPAASTAGQVVIDQALMDRGDGFLETVRAYTPASGDMSEQFDQKTGVQTSAKHLAWSYAAFISCVVARSDARRHRALHH
jgi:GH15 family glucan-1,4-alpha-glucosidase